MGSNIYQFKLNIKSSRIRSKISLKKDTKVTATVCSCQLTLFSCLFFFVNFGHISYCFLVFLLLSLNAAFEIQVLRTSAIKRRGDFRIFKFTSAIRRQKKCQKLFRNICILRRQWVTSMAYLGILPRAMIWFFNS